jgi:uncharacterized membrane protein
MRIKIAVALSLLLVFFSINATSFVRVPSLVYASEESDYVKMNSFYEGFEDELNNWRAVDPSKCNVISFGRQPTPALIYEGESSLVISTSAKGQRKSAICKFFYDFTEEDFVIPLKEDTKFIFAWNIPSKHFSYVGTYLLFNNGKIGYYVSQFYGTSINETSSFTYIFDEPEKAWILHERDVYDDYAIVWNNAQNVSITGLGLILADEYGIGATQTIYYDSIFLGTEFEKPKGMIISTNPSLYKIYPGDTVTYNINISSSYDPEEEVKLIVSEMPEGIIGILEPESGTPPFQSKLIVNSGETTPPGSYILMISAIQKERMQTINVALNVTNPKSDFLLEINPENQVLATGHSANFSLKILQLSEISSTINFSMEGLPDNSSAIFSNNPVSIGPRNESKITITILTGHLTPPGTYEITIIGQSTFDKTSFYSTKATLVISGTSFNLRVFTDRQLYRQGGDEVHIAGNITNSGKTSLYNVSISIQVSDQTNNTVHVRQKLTDINGYFKDSFKIGENFNPGKYLVFVTASKQGYLNSYGQSSFVVGESEFPSVTITSVYSTDGNDINKTKFRAGETVRIVMSVANGGVAMEEGIIWAQVDDPNGIPLQVISIQMKIQNTVRDSKDPITIRTNFKLAEDALSGDYSMNCYVSDKMISKGGKFLAHLQGNFQVE